MNKLNLLSKNWHSRGYIPHFDAEGSIQHLCFRLIDSLPAKTLEKLDQQLAALPTADQDPERRKHIDQLMDNGLGSCVLRLKKCGEIMQSTLLHHDQQHYHLLAWCIMPNHVHVLIERLETRSIAQIVKSWKTFSSRGIRAYLKGLHADQEVGAPGNLNDILQYKSLWQRDYFDRYMRNEEHFHTTLAYIENNPVHAGLCKQAHHWPHSSASARKT